MQILALLLLTCVTLAAAVYTHYRIPYHTTNTRNRWFTHLLLIVVGLAFGWVNSQRYMLSGIEEILAFLSAFGVIHIPAAGILFIKRQQKKRN
ncbi:MAG TPA: hypothetical protein VL987_04480 [Cellvibrio sp.]|jgi:uncharacterized membrane protein YjdF|nr:hypothetical protein [Cellvibrio sp.]